MEAAQPVSLYTNVGASCHIEPVHLDNPPLAESEVNIVMLEIGTED